MLAIVRALAFVKRNCCTDCKLEESKLSRGQIPPPKGFPHLRFIDVWHTGRVSWVCDTQHSRWKCSLHEVLQRLAWCCSGRPPWVDLARFSRCSLVPCSAPAYIAHERMQQSAVSQSHSLNPGLTQLHNWQLHKTCYGRSNRCFNPDILLCGDFSSFRVVTQHFPKKGLKLQFHEYRAFELFVSFLVVFSISCPHFGSACSTCRSPSLWKIDVNHQWILFSPSLVVSAFKSISSLCLSRLQDI